MLQTRPCGVGLLNVFKTTLFLKKILFVYSSIDLYAFLNHSGVVLWCIYFRSSVTFPTSTVIFTSRQVILRFSLVLFPAFLTPWPCCRHYCSSALYWCLPILHLMPFDGDSDLQQTSRYFFFLNKWHSVLDIVYEINKKGQIKHNIIVYGEADK